ncbi:hypothetical protein G3O08_12810 [Cryomorpha ignava]|uniref:Lipocalin family protein n=1 Tax=Cryomorpha ignava TaxID=101383 RepID=A0A7K3WUP1_9FLAO|nr:hypothetical protein [Cryomorpha ignava]NEN24385.1 hypothetical protein [Cryomorpha ignava]
MNREKRTLIRNKPFLENWFVFLSLITLPLLTGCNKTDDFEDLELLTKKNWHLTSRTQGGVDITNDCDLDDILLFEDATKFNYEDGVLNCFENDLNKVGDTWKIIDDLTVLRMKYKFSGEGRGSVVEYWKIIELSETSLIIEDALAEDNDQIPEIRTYLN